MNYQERIKQGKDGEQLFQAWLNGQELGFLRVDQEKDSLSTIFKDAVKRPDYLLLLPSIGFIGIDVKHHKLRKSCFTLTIDKEIERAIAFEHYTRIYLWYAYKDRDYEGHDVWYFISAQKAYEKGEVKNNASQKSKFLSIDIKHFEKITKAEDLGKLFSARIGVLGKLTRAIENSFSAIKPT